MKLYELTQNYNELQSMLENATVEDMEAIQTTLADLEDSIEDKATNICSLIKNIEADAAGYANEIKRLTEHKRTAENQVAQLREYLAMQLTSAGMKKIDAGIFKVSFRKSESVEVEDPTKLPEDFVTVTTEYKPNKVDIKKAIKAGLIVDGATLVAKESLSIR